MTQTQHPFDNGPMTAEPLPADTKGLLAAMRDLVGADACLTAEADTAAFTVDYRGLYRGRTPVVVKPKNVGEVAAVMRWCAEHRVTIVPQGGNTSLAGGAVPDASGTSVVLSLVRMNQVFAIDVQNDTLTVGAGCTLAQARAAAASVDRLFALRIGSEGSCQIGGNLSTNAGGTAVLKYGNMRDLVLGMEVVLADGTVWSNLKGLRKDNSGYDLKQLFIGSEGTLGIITAAVLKLAPVPRARATAMVRVRDVGAAIELLGHAKQQAGQAINAFELISPAAMDLVMSHLSLDRGPIEASGAWQVLIELTSSDAPGALDATLLQLLEDAMERGWVEDAAVAANESQALHMWKIREEISDAQTRTGGSVRCDVSVPISSMADYIEQATARILAIEPDTRMVIYGHVGDGNVHFNPLRPTSRTAADFMSMHDVAMTAAADSLAVHFAGSISAEHGVGVAKRDELPVYKTAADLDLMWRLKQALDPQGLLNPGKVLPPRSTR